MENYIYTIVERGKTIGYADSYDVAENIVANHYAVGKDTVSKTRIIPVDSEHANQYFEDLANKFLQEECREADYETKKRLGRWIDKGFSCCIDRFNRIWADDFYVGACYIDEFNLEANDKTWEVEE